MKKNFVLLATSLFTLVVAAQSSLLEFKITTSAVCEMCKETIEHSLSFEKGVKTVRVDLEKHQVAVQYNPDRTNENKIRTALTKIGYDADSLPADPKSFDKLPDCCKKPHTPHQ